MHPELAERLNLWRMSEFALERIPSPADVYLFRGVGRTNPKDERLFALAEVRELTIVRDEEGRVVSLPELEHMLAEALSALRRFQARRSPRERLLWNRVRLNVWPEVDLAPEEAGALIDRYARETEGLGIETVIIKGRMRDLRGGEMQRARAAALRARRPRRASSRSTSRPRARCSRWTRARAGSCRRAAAAPCIPPSWSRCSRRSGPTARAASRAASSSSTTSTTTGTWCPSTARPAMNEAGIVVGVTRSFTDRHPEGMQRLVLLGDPTKSLGCVAEPECRRIIAALDMAEELGVPVEWFALSSSAPGSRWTPARRTWTGSRRRCAGSSSSRRTAARSTSSSPASTSARSRTGTPRRRC